MGDIATILYIRATNVAALEKKSPKQAAALLGGFRGTVEAVVARHGGMVVRARTESVLAVFADDSRAKANKVYRALKAAAIAVHDVTQPAAETQTTPSGELPRLIVTAGVHIGEVKVELLPSRADGMNVTGEAIEVARVLQSTAVDLCWSIAASRSTLRAAGEHIECARLGSIVLPDDTFIHIAEVTGLVPRNDSRSGVETYQALRDAIARNQRLLERPLDAANTTTMYLNTTDAAPHFFLDGYRIVKKIGEGGMASIFLAEAQGHTAPQVLKVMRVIGEEGVDLLQRFMQEFAVLAEIRHPHVATIHRQGFSVGYAYIAMEYFSRGDLRGLMKSGIRPEVALGYVMQTASALDAIHRAGIVHRDLKPDNLMIRGNGTLALGDFGIAKHVSTLLTATATGVVMGTPYYLSPEQVLGTPVDQRCDLYSLGVIMYEMLTGSKPYRASTREELMDMHVSAPVPSLPPLYASLQPFIDRLMAKNLELRYPSADAFIRDLSRLKKQRRSA